jgi:hypothetical protein
MALETQRSRLKSNGKVNDMMAGQVMNRRVAGGTGGNKVAASSNVPSARATHINATDGALSTLMPGNMMEMQQYYNPAGATGLLPVGIPPGNRRSKLSRGSSVDVSDQQQPAVVCGRTGLYVDFNV